MACCPKSGSAGNPIMSGGDACPFYRKNFLHVGKPPHLVYRKICTRCELDITLHGILKAEENEKLIKPAILPTPLPPLKRAINNG